MVSVPRTSSADDSDVCCLDGLACGDVMADCPECYGTGKRNGVNDTVPCWYCVGAKTQPRFDTRLTQKIICPACGHAHVDDDGLLGRMDALHWWCHECETRFVVRVNRTITYTTFPAGRHHDD